jgi:5-aminolevulinate synthase
MLLAEHQIYVQVRSRCLTDRCPSGTPGQSINYPTVAIGEERLRITPTPGHNASQMAALVDALEAVWRTLGLKRTADWAAEGGRAGVGAIAGQVPVVPRIWTDEQLGFDAGSTDPGLTVGVPAHAGYVPPAAQPEVRAAA